MGELILVRHGQTTWNVTGRITSHSDVPLTALGEDQARALGRWLGGLRIDHAFSSPLVRAQRTAQLLLEGRPGLALELDADLLEIDCGPFEGFTEADLAEPCRIEAVRDWRGGRCYPPGAEPDEAGAARAARFIARVRPLGGTTLAVAHGHFIRVLLASAVLGLPVAGARRLRIDNASAAIIEMGAGDVGAARLRLVGLNQR